MLLPRPYWREFQSQTSSSLKAESSIIIPMDRHTRLAPAQLRANPHQTVAVAVSVAEAEVRLRTSESYLLAKVDITSIVTDAG